jgi:hypothetical protein
MYLLYNHEYVRSLMYQRSHTLNLYFTYIFIMFLVIFLKFLGIFSDFRASFMIFGQVS